MRNRTTGSMIPRMGFSLVEVLVVAAIICLLVSLLFPIIGSSRAMAMKAACVSNLHQVGLVCQAFATDHHGMLPECRGVNPSTFLFTVGNQVEDFMESIPPDVWYCPALQDEKRQPSSWMEKVSSNDWNPTYEFPLGYFYVGNPVPQGLSRFIKPVPNNITMTTGNGEFLFDYCSALRPAPVDGSQVKSWYVFAHRSPAKPEGANVLLTNFSMDFRNTRQLTMGYRFDHPEDVYW